MINLSPDSILKSRSVIAHSDNWILCNDDDDDDDPLLLLPKTTALVSFPLS